MNHQPLNAGHCCGNCRHVFWLAKGSAYFGLGECFEHARADNRPGEALLLVSPDYGLGCPYFEPLDECPGDIFAACLAELLGIKQGEDFPGPLQKEI